MKNIIKILSVTAAIALAGSASAQNTPQREHRAMWMTPYLSGNWPSSKITDDNAASVKRVLVNRMAKFRNQNINTIYYHCRSNCDATYNSAYEPWSTTVSGQRGVAPAFDPFGFLLETAHENGIEVYAWLNPYRYCTKGFYGAGELNYENSHPDWLLVKGQDAILNPGLEEVKQRIVDVVVDILTKYDVDGVIFDDYFYLNGTPMSADADLYAKYKDGGGNLSQADWRRANVNEMVHRVNAAIKATKPWVVFGIGPAGVSSPENIETEYGLPAAPGLDWQYNGIYSDPLAWLKAGDIDFISPQIYWPSKFDALSEWWAKAALKFGRHCYPSIDITDITSMKYAEVAREIERTREVSPAETAGLVFFQYYNFVNYYETFDGKNRDLGTILGSDVWNTKALRPLHTWNKSTTPKMVTNVSNDGTTLTWDANDAKRYVVYKQPLNQTTAALTLEQVVYKNSYTLPKDAAEYSWYVSAYDRYANLSAPLGVGATATVGTAPILTYPADGEAPVPLFSFKWSHSSTLKSYIVEVSDDADFGTILGTLYAEGDTQVSSAGLPTLVDGKTYYWRVRPVDVNCEHPVSNVRSFVAKPIAMTFPTASQTGIPVSPTLTWTAAVEGAEYTVEISRSADMLSNEVLTATTTAPSYTIPDLVLNSGRQYYVRVTATKNGAQSKSAITPFTTVDVTDYTAPTLINPSANGQTLHVKETIRVAPWSGMTSVVINIAATNTFPVRSMYTATLNDFATESPELGKAKISGKPLENGKTYYLRARGAYQVTTSTSPQYTDYTPTYTFVYSSEAGVGDITADTATTWLENGILLHVGDAVDTVTVYNLAGGLVASYEATAGMTIDLDNLTAGAYLVRAGQTTLKVVK